MKIGTFLVFTNFENERSEAFKSAIKTNPALQLDLTTKNNFDKKSRHTRNQRLISSYSFTELF